MVLSIETFWEQDTFLWKFHISFIILQEEEAIRIFYYYIGDSMFIKVYSTHSFEIFCYKRGDLIEISANLHEVYLTGL